MMKVPLFKIGCRVGVRACAWLVLGLLLVASSARAQGQEAEPAPQEQGARQQRRVPGGNLMRRLNLTPEQRTQLREIRSQSEPEVREFTRRLRLARRALDDAIYADVLDDALVEQRARAVSEAQAALLRLRAATELKVRRVLTPGQLQSFRDLRVQAQRRRLLQTRRREAARPLVPGAREERPPRGANAPAGAQDDTRPANPPGSGRRGRFGRP